jgi:geranyl-CoA carboxylase alpha subunit
MSFSKILIANRGEIARRVMRTAHRLGYRTVAVFSEADRDAPHVREADEAVHIGPAPAAQSYLDIGVLIDAARRTGADAVHPGYGFLSERADFARACADAGLVFIGPPAQAIEAMGDKAGAKRRMLAAGVPCAPGYLGEDQSDARLAAEAQALGVPLLVKAVAGGGGRGMRLVRRLDELPAALEGARREATSAFGDGTLMLERLIENGRHVEVQVFADRHGRTIHLGERDCTAQRRRQKVIEEAPSPIVDAATRAAMGRDAVAAARAVGYVGAGTVEFIVDADGRHHFLEMNTRLQVEHPVTEAVTGHDLVEWQLRVAAGEPLPVTQDEVGLRGHAIEARLYAEDPYAGFVPQTGRIVHWRPATDARGGVRVDDGVVEGGEVTPYYDAMVAKLIVHGRDRADAIRRLVAALEHAPLLGVANNAGFLADLLRHPDFRDARMTTTRLDEWLDAGAAILQRPRPDDTAWALAAAAFALRDGRGHRSAGVAGYDLTLAQGDERRTWRVQPHHAGLDVGSGDAVHRFETLEHHGHSLRYALRGVRRHAVAVFDGTRLHLAVDGRTFAFDEPSPLPASDARADPRRARAPVAGVVAHVAVAAGERVRAGQPLVCVEAMKMEMWQHATADGVVATVHVALRDAVTAGTLLVELDLGD